MIGNNEKLFSTVSQYKTLPLYDDSSSVDAKKVAEFLDFNNQDVAKLSEVAVTSVRYDKERIPPKVQERMNEIANVCELVAEYFKGDAQKTALWFRLENPHLGNISPRDMLRFGRYKKLIQFIADSRSGNTP